MRESLTGNDKPKASCASLRCESPGKALASSPWRITPVFSSLTLSLSSRTATALIDGSRASYKAAFLLISAACESIRDNRYRRRVVKSSRVPKLLTARVCTSLRRKRDGGSSSSG